MDELRIEEANVPSVNVNPSKQCKSEKTQHLYNKLVKMGEMRLQTRVVKLGNITLQTRKV